jgi:hypothetical protein
MAARTESRAAIAAIEVDQIATKSMTLSPMATIEFWVATSGVAGDKTSMPLPQPNCNFDSFCLARKQGTLAIDVVDDSSPITN